MGIWDFTKINILSIGLGLSQTQAACLGTTRGRFFWSNVRLRVSGDMHNSLLLQILHQRPCILPGIRYLHLVESLDNSDIRDNHNTLIRFAAMCESLSNIPSFKPESVHLFLNVRESDLRSLSRGNGTFHHLQRFNQIFVGQNFLVGFSIDLDEWEGCGCTKDDYCLCAETQEERLCVMYEPLVRELMLPDSLRPKRLTETEAYLASRDVDQKELGRRTSSSLFLGINSKLS